MIPKKSHTSYDAGTVILDEVLDAIAAHLTANHPERGGLLFGPPGQKMITRFLPDLEAPHHHTTYTPSEDICRCGPEIERSTGLEYKGIIHSHPGSMDHPSSPDIQNASKALALNAHLQSFMMPIVTLGRFVDHEFDSHELPLRGGKMSFWVVDRRGKESTGRARRERASSLALWSDLKRVAGTMQGCPEVASSSLMDIEGVTAAVYQLDTKDGVWIFAAVPGYPFMPPLVIAPEQHGGSVSIAWNLEVPSEQRLAEAIRPHLGGVETVSSPRKPVEVVKPARASVLANRPLRMIGKMRAIGRKPSTRRRAALLLLVVAGSFFGSYAGRVLPPHQRGNAIDSGPSRHTPTWIVLPHLQYSDIPETQETIPQFPHPMLQFIEPAISQLDEISEEVFSPEIGEIPTSGS